MVLLHLNILFQNMPLLLNHGGILFLNHLKVCLLFWFLFGFFLFVLLFFSLLFVSHPGFPDQPKKSRAKLQTKLQIQHKQITFFLRRPLPEHWAEATWLPATLT